GFDFGRAERAPVVGQRAVVGRRALNRVQSTQRGGARLGAAPASELARVPQASGAAREQIGIQRNNHVGFFNLIDGVHVPAERLARALARWVAADGLVLVPLGLGELAEQAANLVRQRRRNYRFAEQTQPGSTTQALPF